MKISNISTVIVTYNRSQILKECLFSILNQTYSVDAIYLVDNASTDDTTEMLIREGYIDYDTDFDLLKKTKKVLLVNNKEIVFFYIKLKENIGGAGGFYEGLKKAYDDKYDWFWLMDDDAEPKNDCIENIIKVAKKIDNPYAFSNLKISVDGSIQYWHRGWIDMCSSIRGLIKPIRYEDLKEEAVKIDHSSFVGFFISRKFVDSFGLPKKEFFISYDDFEYCLRAYGKADIYLVKDSVILHKDQSKMDLVDVGFLRKSKRKPYTNLWLSYFEIRNLVYLKYLYCSIKIKFLIFVWILKKILGVLIYDDNKVRRIRFYLNAYIDGVKGIFDNEKPKRILYG